jgi:SAM-dependent methyltransferase
MEEDLKQQLRQAYELKAAERDARTIPDWRREQRDNFATLLLREGKRTLLELGAGTGTDGRYFQDLGLDVLCTDLSPEMVRLCRAKGLNARVMDNTLFDLPPTSFDAVYAMNSLLHLPSADLPAVLQNIHTVLKPGGLFFMGVYGGVETEGIWEDDDYQPKRFFAFYSDEQLKQILSQYFHIQTFTIIPYSGSEPDMHHQSVTLRKSGQVNQSAC